MAAANRDLALMGSHERDAKVNVECISNEDAPFIQMDLALGLADKDGNTIVDAVESQLEDTPAATLEEKEANENNDSDSENKSKKRKLIQELD
mmetsp:Transcript_15551/g.39597  ORF Transcript_15551/g.39597 Transcript_15551/m.39597 type:complete len:93 (+) Transcript_15551:219-497(+)